MLPFWVRRDFEDVIADLKTDGFACRTRWFARRAPESASRKIGGFDKLAASPPSCAAPEPWHVMGSDSRPRAAPRAHVDSAPRRASGTLVRGRDAGSSSPHATA